MGRYIEAKCRLCRRYGTKLFLKGSRCETAKCAMEREHGNLPPGTHGASRKRLTDYGIHLREVQRAKKCYGLGHRQMKQLYQKALRQTGNTGDNLLRNMERRLDNIVFRLTLALSRSHARQMIAHGHVTLNGKRVHTPSILVKGGDTIGCCKNESSKKMAGESVKATNKPDMPSWLKLNAETLEGTVVQLPAANELQVPFDSQLMVEYLSR